jgi:hypothetical protein
VKFLRLASKSCTAKVSSDRPSFCFLFSRSGLILTQASQHYVLGKTGLQSRRRGSFNDLRVLADREATLSRSFQETGNSLRELSVPARIESVIRVPERTGEQANSLIFHFSSFRILIFY